MRSPCTGTCGDNSDTNPTCDSHHGLQYNSAYYEEEQLYSENLDTPNEPCNHQKPGFVPTPIRINKQRCTNIDMPPINWYRYNSVPNTLNVTNTGRTILISGQWPRGKPYIEGGPLNGTYIFSQIHFHCPSEHEINGQRYPLEMHVVHHKTSYLTQERAMYEKDGTVVLVYLFQVLGSESTPMSSFTKCAPQIEKVNSQTEAQNVALEEIVQPFTSNYYIYWGSVSSNKKSYLLQWLISGSILCVTKKEADELLSVMNFEDCIGYHPRVKPENDAVYFVEEIEHIIEVIKEPEKMESNPAKEESEIEVVKDEPRPPICCTHCGTQICWDHNTGSLTATTCSLPETTDNIKDCPAKEEEPCQSKSEEVCKFGKFSRLQVKFCYRKKMLHRKFYCFKKTTLCKKKRIKCSSPKKDDSCEESVPELICYEAPEKKKKKKKKKKYGWSDSSESGRSKDESEKSSKNKKKKCECPEPPERRESNTSKDSCSSKKKKKKKKKKEKKQCDCPESTESNTTNNSKTIKKKKKQCDNPEPNERHSIDNSCAKEEKDQCKDGAESETAQSKCSESSSRKKKQKKKKKRGKKSECPEVANSSTENDSDPCCEKKKIPCEYPENIDSTIKICCEPCSEEKKTKKDSCQVRESEFDNKDPCSTKKKVEINMELPVHCRVATITPEKTFDDILSEYNSTWLDDSKIFGDSNLCGLSGTDSKGTDTFNSLKSPVDSGNTLTTLFEKKPSKVPDTLVDNIQTISGNSLSNGRSSTVLDTKYLNEIKCVLDQSASKSQNQPELTVNSVTITSPKEGPDPSQSEFKDFCIQVELLFRSRNEDFSGCLAQEYNLTLICDQNILQEYRGTLYPSNLVMGNYEKLTLLPKYPELDDICIRLQDCTVKMESMDQICMRAKFLLKKIDFNQSDAAPDGRPETLTVANANIQCNLEDFEKVKTPQVVVPRSVKTGDVNSLRGQKKEAKKEKPRKVTSQKPPSTSRKTVKREVEESEKSESYDQLIFDDELSENSDVRVKLLKNSCNDGEGNSKKIVFDSVQRPAESDKKEEQTDRQISENLDKETKDVIPNQKKTIYFACEKIEKDRTTGKKIFVGSFRTKEEVKLLSKGKKMKLTEIKEEKTLMSICAKESDCDFESMKSRQNEESTSFFNPKRKLRREEIKGILHKPKRKEEGNCHKQEELNLVVGKLIDISKGSVGFRRLTNLLGVSKLSNHKISVYELQRPSEIQDLNLLPSGTLTPEKESSPLNSERIVSKKFKAEAPARDLEKNKSNKSVVEKPSKKAVIVIPVEAKSFSKIEVILVEHKEALNKNVTSSEDEIPCLKYDH